MFGNIRRRSRDNHVKKKKKKTSKKQADKDYM